MPQTRLGIVSIVVGSALLTATSCASLSDLESGPPVSDERDGDRKRGDKQRRDEPKQKRQDPKHEPARDPASASVWSCSYSPTYDDDWHNDVLCSNGAESHRPYLREWDSFVTESEIMASAQEYENQLNAG